MEIFILILAAVLIITGIIGSVLPAIPGPPLAFAGLLAMFFASPPYHVSLWFLIPLGVFTVAISIIDYLLPSWGTKYFGGTKYGSWGSNIGLIVGAFTSWLGPWGIIIGPFFGALMGELIGGQKFVPALKSATGSFLGFVTGTFMKVVLCLFMLAVFAFYLIKNLI